MVDRVFGREVIVPGGIQFNLEDPFAQLQDRADNGFNRVNSVTRAPFDRKQIKAILGFLSRNPDFHLSFDMGGAYGNEALQTYRDIACSISKLANESGQVGRSIGMKFPSMIKPQDVVVNEKDIIASARSPFDSRSYETNLENMLAFMMQISGSCEEESLSLDIENSPVPDYTNVNKGNKFLVDPSPRWGGAWSVVPSFMGQPMTNAREINKVMEYIGVPRLQLDIEHLISVCEWGNTFNLEDSDNGVLRFGDLEDWRKEHLRRSFGYSGLRESDVLFDMSKLTDHEESLAHNYGYVIRIGQPPVHTKKLKLRDELEAFDLEIETVTPGFQVERGFLASSDLGEINVIGSHMPGIIPKYTYSEVMGREILARLEHVYGVVGDFMKSRGISSIEYAPQASEGDRIVYHGQTWNDEARNALAQKGELFRRGREGTFSGPSPHFL